MSEANKAVIRRLVDGYWTKRDVKVFDEVFAARFIDHHPMPGVPGTKDGLRQLTLGLQSAFPDGQTMLDDVLADGDRVAWRWTFQGTQKGPVMGIPATGKSITITGITIDRIAAGQIVERWSQIDTLGMMTQLGAVPPQR